MDLGLRQRSCVVLASTRGLGLAAAEALLAEGARVALCGRDPARVAEARARLAHEHGDRATVDVLDVTALAALRAHLEAVKVRWGSVDVLVVNSGGPAPVSAADLDAEALARGLDGTLGYAAEAIHTVLPWMRARRWGRIVAMTSLAVRQPIPGLAISNALRAGLTGYLKTLATEVAADGVLVNSICTGMFDTDRLRELFEKRAAKSGRTAAEERARTIAEIPAGRIGRPEEYGALVAFLASERAAYLTGVALAHDGGASRALL
ncbi:MAG: SDR family oxidoreductase [Planctomycetes bacterium]|nr:SDR family oxidoreductase [Planctomycetota bacterium]